jgi:hypothetical protein
MLWRDIRQLSLRPSQSRRFFLLLVFIVATARFCLTIHYFERAVVPRTPEAMRVAYALYQTGEWANPYPTPTGPTAHVAPLFPLLVACIYKIFGTKAMGWFGLQFFEALALCAQIVLIPFIAETLGIGLRTGVIGALIGAFGLENSLRWEHSYVGLLLALAALLAGKFLGAPGALDQPQNSKPARGSSQLVSPIMLASALGVVWGTVLLLNPTPALIWGAWLALGWWTLRRESRRALLPVVVLPVLMILPWAWRNYRALHSLVPIRSNLGLELSVSNNPCAGFSIIKNHRNDCFEHPNESPEEALQVARLGEVNYNHARLQQAVAWITANPKSFLRLTLQRFVYFWFPTETGRFRDYLFSKTVDFPLQPWSVYLSTVLSIPGMFMLWRRSRHGAVICASFLLLYPPIYYLVQFDERYRFPILWVTFLLGAVALRPALDWAHCHLMPRWTRSSGGLLGDVPAD